MEPNLVVTYSPAHAAMAELEVRALLGDVAMERPVAGVFLVRTPKNPKQIVRQLRAHDREVFRITSRWVPIEHWVDAHPEAMTPLLRDYNERIRENERWMLALRKRAHTTYRTPDLVRMLTEAIDRRHVDMTWPQKIVAVEIIGNRAGMALLDTDEYLDVRKL